MQTFNISGQGFGHSRRDIYRASVGGERCPEITWVSAELIICSGIRMTQWSSGAVEVELSSNQSMSAQLLQRYGAPRVTAVQPDSAGVTGGVRHAILCADCGEAFVDVINVTIGGKTCENVTVESSQGGGLPLTINCDSPPGAGASQSVEVKTRGYRTSLANTRFSYVAPTVTSISPAEMLTGTISYNVTVYGSNLGAAQSDVEWISIGQQRCNAVLLISSTEATCFDV